MKISLETSVCMQRLVNAVSLLRSATHISKLKPWMVLEGDSCTLEPRV